MVHSLAAKTRRTPKRSDKMKIPDKIYLQVQDEFGEDQENVTWCKDRLDASDIEYIRDEKTLKMVLDKTEVEHLHNVLNEGCGLGMFENYPDAEPFIQNFTDKLFGFSRANDTRKR